VAGLPSPAEGIKASCWMTATSGRWVYPWIGRKYLTMVG
jgi:hypothetical protein